jgi:hypothetical protein
MNDETLIFEGNRKKAFLLLLISAGFACAGLFLNPEGEMLGWFAAAFFGLCFLVFVYMLIPGTIRLKVDRSGIEMKTMFKPMKLAWADVDGFYVGRVPGSKMIGINFSKSYGKLRAGRKFSASLTGMEGALPDHFNKSAEELCEILNRCKQEWGQGA